MRFMRGFGDCFCAITMQQMACLCGLWRVELVCELYHILIQMFVATVENRLFMPFVRGLMMLIV